MNLYLRLLLLRWSVLWRRVIGLWDVARTPFRVSPTDLDVLGHMNNGTFWSLMDLGRVDLMLRSGFWRIARARGWYPVVAGQTITYLKSLTLGQRFELQTRLLGFHGRWIYIQQSFWVGETLCAHAVVRARFLGKQGSVGEDQILALVGEPPADALVPEWVVDGAEHTKRP